MKNKVILLTSDKFGHGDPQLGENVLETFFTLLKQNEELPYAVFCMNRGVLTLTEGSFVSVHLQEMQKSGVHVYGCRTCVDFYEVSDKMIVGEITGMDHFLQLATRYEIMTIS